MTTQLEKLVAVFDDLGIGYYREKRQKDTRFPNSTSTGYNTEGTTIRIEQGQIKVDGYYGFYADFYFELDGRFIDIGIYE
jgi:hypothetical protein